MKSLSLYYTTASEKSKKSFIKKTSFIVAAIFLFVMAAIPTSASVSYEAVKIDVEMLQAMFAAGDLTVTCTVVNTSSVTRAINYWNIASGELGTLAQGANLNLYSPRFSQVTSNESLFWFPFNFYLLSGQAIQTIYTFSMPFDYIGTSQSEIFVGAFTPGRMTTALNASLSIYDDDENLIDTFTQTTFNQSFCPLIVQFMV